MLNQSSKQSGSLSRQATSLPAFIATLLLFTALPAQADESAKVAEALVKNRFLPADQDGDGRLSPDEFVVGRGDEPTARRDFKLFDFDRDGALSAEEFAPIAVSVVGVERGPMTDPFVTRLVDVVVAALDKSLNNWIEHPAVEYNALEFVRQISQRFGRVLPEEMSHEVDTDRNGKVNRAEAKRFLEIQFGVRRGDGELLRDPNAMYVNHSLFVHTDLNRDNVLDKKEWLERSSGGEKAEEEFALLDGDKSGTLTFKEFKTLPRVHRDPIAEFRQLDKNLDAKVDQEEMTSGIPDWKKISVKHVVEAFDLDHDGALSLEEWYVTPHANELLNWFKKFKDLDGDQVLRFEEFVFEQRTFNLLRLFFFRRFDRNGDGMLAQGEYEFRLRIPTTLYSLNADGTDLKKIDCGTLVRIGSPSVSPDGKWVAFDGSAQPRESPVNWNSMIVPIEGGEPKSICTGSCPNWSSDGMKIASSRYQPQASVWIIDLVGEDDRSLGPGAGAQWSPDGKKIYFNQAGTILMYDVEKQKTETIIQAGTTEFRQYDVGAAWSPDSKRVCVWGFKQSGNKNAWYAVLIDMVSQDKEPKERIKECFEGHGAGSDFAWHPDGHRIVCTQICDERHIMQFYEFDPHTDAPPKLLAGQPEDQMAVGSSWTPDGKKLIFVAGDY